ncbi:hypothetical protein [Frondihabitans sucicola]|nr:hypothetical protein [Frondihabitans sucicola]
MTLETARSTTWQFWDASASTLFASAPGWVTAKDEADARERAGRMGHAFIREVASITVTTTNYPADQSLGEVHCNPATFDHIGPWGEVGDNDKCEACGFVIDK